MRFLLLLVVGPALGFAAFAWHARAENEFRLSAIASEIAGRPVTVHCQGAAKALVDVSPYAGSVRFDSEGRPADVAQLNKATCGALAEFARGDKRALDCLTLGFTCNPAVSRAARALHVLAHESWHLRGVRDEAAADCYAFQRTALAAERLGAGLEGARAVARLAMALRSETAPAEYRSASCHPGGALDLDPANPSWP